MSLGSGARHHPAGARPRHAQERQRHLDRAARRACRPREARPRSKAQIGDLEPLRTESFQINYHKAKSVAEFLKSKDQTVLSKRGSVVPDERSNKIFVNDVPSRLEDMRRLIAEIDVEQRQVLIEAQIVEATDTFARNLGVRLGFGSKSGGRLGTTDGGVPVYRTSIGGGLAGRVIRPGRSKPNRISLRMRWP
jgi:type IV pilus assembly protein PilQ